MSDPTQQQPVPNSTDGIADQIETDRSEDVREVLSKRKVSASRVILLLIPISISMAFVIMYVKFVCENDCRRFTRKFSIIGEKVAKKDSSVLKEMVNGSVNAIIILLVIVCNTTVLFCLFYFRCYRLIITIIMFSFFLIFFVIFSNILRKLLIRFNLAFDVLTTLLILWNNAVSGIIFIFWKGPLVLQQIFLVNMSVFSALNLMTILSEWTIWALLVVLVFWDLFAVFCPFGPLRLLISTYEKRKKEDKDFKLPPGLLYSTMIWFILLNSVPNSSTGHSSENNDPETEQTFGEKRDGPKLGLGDFIFYSLLMGMASIYGDFNLIMGCYLGIMVGLCVTMIFLVICQMPLPALPISITFAILIFVISKFCVTPFLNQLNNDLIYI